MTISPLDGRRVFAQHHIAVVYVQVYQTVLRTQRHIEGHRNEFLLCWRLLLYRIKPPGPPARIGKTDDGPEKA